MSLSRTVKRLFLWAFILMLSVSFIAYFGLTGDTLGGGGIQNSIGKVDGRPVQNDRNSYFYDVLAELSAYYSRVGYPLTAEMQTSLTRQAFYEVAAQMVVEEIALEAGLDASESQLIDFLKNEYFSGNTENWNEFVRMGDKARQSAIQVKARKRYLRKMYEQTVLYSLPASHSRLAHYIKVAKIAKEGIFAKYDGNQDITNKITDSNLRDYFEKNSSRYTTVESFEDPSAIGSVKESTIAESPAEGGDSLIGLPKFEDVYEKVYEDYLLENRNRLQNEVSEEVTTRITSAIARINSVGEGNKQARIAAFNEEFKADGFTFHQMEPLSFFSSEVSFSGESIPPLQSDIVHTVMGTAVEQVGFTQDENLNFFAFIITDESNIQRRSDENLYLQYASEQESNYYQILRRQFYTKIFAGRTLEFNGNVVEF